MNELMLRNETLSIVIPGCAALFHYTASLYPQGDLIVHTTFLSVLCVRTHLSTKPGGCQGSMSNTLSQVWLCAMNLAVFLRQII